jgi:ABC-2 type transport system ATP-binding protein
LPGPAGDPGRATNDVDPLRRRLLWEQVRQLGDWGAAVPLVTHNVLEAEKAVDRLAVIDNGTLIAEGTPSAMKAHDRGHLRLQLMIAPGRGAPALPSFAQRSTLVGRNLMTVIGADDATAGITWAQQAIAAGLAEEYARDAALSYVMLTAWTMAAWAGTAWVVGRRR